MGKRRCSHVSHLPVGAELSCPQLEPVPPPSFPPVCLPSYIKEGTCCTCSLSRTTLRPRRNIYKIYLSRGFKKIPQ